MFQPFVVDILLLGQELQIINIFLQNCAFLDVLIGYELVYSHETRHLLMHFLVYEGDVVAPVQHVALSVSQVCYFTADGQLLAVVSNEIRIPAFVPFDDGEVMPDLEFVPQQSLGIEFHRKDTESAFDLTHL